VVTRAEDVAGSTARDRRRRPRPSRTSFIGRDGEIASLLQLLRTPDIGLVTITGRSGAGKTRLAIEVARRMGGELPGGAVLVDCSSIDEPGLLVGVVAAALDLKVVPGQRPDDALRRSLQYEPALILADDVDQVPDGVEILLDILDECPGTHLLATASAPLRARGERVVRLGTLSLPSADDAGPEDLQQSPAVALFCERASAVDQRFRCTADNAAAVARLVGRLDGLPLAIELAAARVATLSPAAQLDMLDRGSPLDLAPVEPGERAGRHTELRSAIDWSHRLLGPREQVLFRRMAVFAGGCSLDSLLEVSAEPAWGTGGFLDALTNLVDVHLVEPDATSFEARYVLLPTVVDYARERLVEAGESERMTARHTDWFAAFARRTAELGEREQVARLVADRRNLHAALGRIVGAADDVARGLQLAADLAPLWFRQGLFSRTRAWFDTLLARADETDVPAEVHARALLWRALIASDEPAEDDRRAASERLDTGLRLARASGSDGALLFGLSCVIGTLFVIRDVDAAAAAAREGLALARGIRDERWQVRFTCWAGVVAQETGDTEAAARLGAESLERATRGGDLTTVVRASQLLMGLPRGTPGVPDSVPARDTLLAICRDIGDVVAEGWVLGGLAWAALADGDHARAAAWCGGGLRLGQRTGALSSGGFAIAALVVAAARREDDAIAARLHGSLARALSALQVGISAQPAALYFAAVDEARSRFGAEAFDAVVAEGTLLSWDAALAAGLEYASTLASRETRRMPADDGRRAGADATVRVERLTPRELDVLRLLAEGDTNKDIAIALGLRPKTVMHHSVAIYGKLGVRGRAEATAWAYRNGLVGERADA